MAIQGRHQTAENGCFHLFSEEVLSENDIQAVLVTFCCYDYGANAFETVANMHTNIGYYLILGQLRRIKETAETPRKKGAITYMVFRSNKVDRL